MDVVSLCPLRTSSLVWRGARGEWVETVVCKATFTLTAGEAQLADAQEPPDERDEHWSAEATSSLCASNDVVPWKRKAEVLLVGKAFSPGKEPVKSLVARLEVAGVDKSIEVWCDRARAADRTIHEGPRFTSMPLVYERAAGGPATSNPVGVGATRLPNLQPPGARANDPGVVVAPIGFGPIAPTWPGRASRRAVDVTWPAGGRSMPEGFDPGFFNAAPSDQQIDALGGPIRLVLENLHRDHPRLVTILPDLQPRAVIDTGGGQREIALRCDTLWIDTDRAICTLTWRGFVPLQAPDDEGHVIVDMPERAPVPVSARGPESRRVDREPAQPLHLRTSIDLEIGLEHTAAIAASRAPVLPFQRPPEPSIPVIPPAPTSSRPTLGGPMGRLAAPDAPLSIGEAVVRANQGMPTHLRVTPAAVLGPPRAGEVPALVPLPVAVAAPGLAAKIGAWIPTAIGADPADGPAQSALAASNAAAGRSPDAAASAASSSSSSVAPRASGDAMEMVWLDPDFLERIQRKIAWRPFVAAAKAASARDDDEGGSREQRKEARERREVLSVLRHGDPTSAADLDDLLTRALDAGAVTPPLVLVGGALAFRFDELDTLKAAMAIVAPFASADKKLKELCDTLAELLVSPWIAAGTSGFEGLILRLREAFAQTPRGVPTGHFEARTEQLLLERRSYQKRTVMGQEWIRASFTPGDGGEAIPTYLPASLAKELPMFPAFRARLIAEVRPRVDHAEAHPIALRVAALARLIVRSRS